MNPQLIPLFRDALDLPIGERSAYLDVHCTDPDLRAQIDSLLLTAEATQPPLPNLALPHEAFVRPNSRQVDRTGEVIGAFRLLKPIGSGGMGAVWLAERVGGFQQQVAIKWLHAGLSASARQRFARERETLAKLEHPGIARIVDGGRDGEADWFAMEYVQGRALDAYVDATKASLNQRINLLIGLCDAVQYAHQNLVVHRDLKPSNIMVQANGAPKLLDFGIAKQLDQLDELTQSQAPMSLAYAAPEQIRGDAITTATDVYALGVILYELLTGERPHKPINKQGADGALSLLQAITDTDATAPSSVLNKATHTVLSFRSTQLKGDLDTIVLKALSRDPARRYGSAQALADDLGAFLRQMPIRARPETWRYRAAKFVRRHVLGVSLGSIALGLVAALSIVSFMQAARALRQQRLAETQAQRATAVQDFLIGLFEQQRPDETLGASVSAKDLLDRAETKLAQNSELGEGFSKGLNTETRAALLKTLSQLRYDLGDYSAALKLGNQAVKLAETESGADSTAYALALVERSFSLSDSGEPAAAIADCQRALPVLRAAKGIDAALFASLTNCSALERDNGALDAAAALLGEAEATLKNLPVDRGRTYRLLSARGRLAIARADYAAGTGIYDQYISLLRADPLAAPSDLSSALHSRATTKNNMGKTRLAIADYREALAIQQRILGPNHMLTIQSMSSLANELYVVGEVAESLRMGDQALVLARSSLSSDNPALSYLLNDAAIAANRRQDIAGATVLMQEAIDVNTRAFGNAHPDTLLMICNLSSLQRKLGRFDAARATAFGVLTRLADAKVAPLSSEAWREAHFRLAMVADRVGDAAAQLEHGNAIIAALPEGAAAKELPQALSQQALALIRLGKTQDALASAARLESVVRQRYEPATSQHGDLLAYVAWVAMEAGDATRALALSTEALAGMPVAAESWTRFDSLLAAIVQWRALTALNQNAAAKSWANALRERQKTAPPDEARYWQAIASEIEK